MTMEISVPHWQAEDGWHIDVRGLGPPQPMVQILTLLQITTDSEVIVHHDREPIYLYPELAERGWNHEVIPGEDGEVRLRLWPE
ncbi:MAG: DUF2249 domain-containing protein [Rhodospirillaceae bacterium]|jgi:hypothetical protein|nr:DUF2249 domain-containing protein [Rhodospirillaceae bacterium]MBT5899264.1 DUF2249 domain-containing protein [Rhodospirillaceae bacterium]MBT6429681.1 DUF2249 domain-containing protein [Rhodospirillaceae bacterium]MBT7664592.1 DUF2249 domain-containing protein [Rhodospirillaceae bacterium]MBT7758902.1 DUF2249 domain-containing protein [Rhodospirillaceae bacterium]